MNEDSQLALDLLYKYIPNINPAVRNQIRLPQYLPTSLPRKEDIQQVLRWTSEVVGRTLTVEAEELIDRRFSVEP